MRTDDDGLSMRAYDDGERWVFDSETVFEETDGESDAGEPWACDEEAFREEVRRGKRRMEIEEVDLGEEKKTFRRERTLRDMREWV